MAIHIETEAINSYANQLRRINEDASDNLWELESQINSLRCDWDGIASQRMGDSFWDIKNKYFADREDELNRYVEFLVQVVENSYEKAESMNIKDADEIRGNGNGVR